MIVLEPGDADMGDAITLDACASAAAGATPRSGGSATRPSRPEDICLYIYTSGTTGPPKGCLLSHGNYRAITDAVVEPTASIQGGDSTYLFLPLAHAFAILIQFATFELGATIAYWSRNPKMIIADIAQVSPSYFPSVPRMFEKIYTLATANVEDKEGLRKAVDVGVKVRLLRDAGEPVPEELAQAFDAAEEQLFKNVRGLFGNNIRECVTGAAPIAPEILEFFYACGVPVMEGYGMTETSTSATVNRPHAGEFRFGSVGKAAAGRRGEDRRRRRGAAQGPEHLPGLLQERRGDEGDARGRLAAHRRPRPPRRGRLPLHHRPQEGHHHHGGRQEHHARQPRERPQAEPLDLAGCGDRRPAAVPGRADHARPGGGAGAGPAARASTARTCPRSPQDESVRAEIQKAIDEVNAHVGPVEQIKRFEILDHDLSQETGELTPTLKVKRNVVHEKYADLVDRIYDTPR